MNEKSSKLMYKLMGDYDIKKHPVLWEKEQAVRAHLTELETEIEALKKQAFDLICAGNEMQYRIREQWNASEESYPEEIIDWMLEVEAMEKLTKKENNEN